MTTKLLHDRRRRDINPSRLRGVIDGLRGAGYRPIYSDNSYEYHAGYSWGISYGTGVEKDDGKTTIHD